MTTKLEIKIFNGKGWETVWVRETYSNLKPEHVSLEFESDEWKIWGTPDDFIDKGGA